MCLNLKCPSPSFSIAMVAKLLGGELSSIQSPRLFSIGSQSSEGIAHIKALGHLWIRLWDTSMRKLSWPDVSFSKCHLCMHWLQIALIRPQMFECSTECLCSVYAAWEIGRVSWKLMKMRYKLLGGLTLQRCILTWQDTLTHTLLGFKQSLQCWKIDWSHSVFKEIQSRLVRPSCALLE